MRSWRYKQRRAHDAVTAHNYGWNIYGGSYAMQQNHMDLFYQIKHYDWWSSVHRWMYRFVTDYDAKNYVYSNMELCKIRRGYRYDMK
jgi:hypothetical protein